MWKSHEDKQKEEFFNNDDDENVEISNIGLFGNLLDTVWLLATGNLRW